MHISKGLVDANQHELTFGYIQTSSVIIRIFFHFVKPIVEIGFKYVGNTILLCSFTFCVIYKYINLTGFCNRREITKKI